MPLAELIQVDLNCDYFEGEEEALVQKALMAKGTVLIAWKHRNMHVIANAILGNKTTAPQYWPFNASISSGSLSGKGKTGHSRKFLNFFLPATSRM